MLLAPLLVTLLATPVLSAPKRVAVSIDNLRFSPAAIEVEVGDTIVWTNNDDREHTVTADTGAFNSGRIKPGRTYTWTVDKPGKHAYGSDPFPRARGTVTVKGK
jgi:plastocyanin